MESDRGQGVNYFYYTIRAGQIVTDSQVAREKAG